MKDDDTFDALVAPLSQEPAFANAALAAKQLPGISQLRELIIDTLKRCGCPVPFQTLSKDMMRCGFHASAIDDVVETLIAEGLCTPNGYGHYISFLASTNPKGAPYGAP